MEGNKEGREGEAECLHTNVFIVSASGGQKPQFWANFDFWGLLYRPPFTDDSQIWCVREQTQGLQLPTKFHLNGSLCQLPVAKNNNSGQILTFLGLLYRPPFTDEDQIWCAIADPTPDPWCTLTCQISSRSVYSFAPIFTVFWTSAFSVVTNWKQSEKAEHGFTTTNLPLPNGIKIVSVLQRLHGEIWRTISDVQKHDK